VEIRAIQLCVILLLMLSLPPSGLLEAVSVLVAEPEVFALVSVGAELSPAGVVLAAEPGVVPVAADFSPAVVVWVAALRWSLLLLSLLLMLLNSGRC